MKRILLLCFLLVAVSGCSSIPSCAFVKDSECTRVLFIGNSYTFVNDLPGTVAQLAISGGYHVETGMAAEGSFKLSDHVNSPQTLAAIQSKKWTYVVLQEQSQLPAVAQFRTQQMYPATRTLVSKIQAVGATPIFFITWAHRDGWPENGLNDYESMQAQIDTGYLTIAQELNSLVSPVGIAWFTATKHDPPFELWQADGSHPTEQGTYLAACVFYAVVFHQTPVGLSYQAGLSKDIAQALQTIASQTVLGHP